MPPRPRKKQKPNESTEIDIQDSGEAIYAESEEHNVSAVESLQEENAESHYERVRLENIRRNQEFLATLGLDEERNSLLSSSRSSATVSKRGQGSSSKKSIAALPTRRSGRVTIDKMKQQLEELRKTGAPEDIAAMEEELAQMEAKRADGSYTVTTTDAAATTTYSDFATRFSTESITLLEPKNVDTSDPDYAHAGQEIVDSLRLYSKSVVPVKSDEDVKQYFTRTSKLKVAEQDVAKLTEARITSLYCHPSSEKLIVVAGDKAGYLGIWDVDAPSKGHGGVFRYRPHVETIIKIHSTFQDPSKLFTVSYDGTIRSVDLERQAFNLEFESPEPQNDVSFTDAAFYYERTDMVLTGRSDGFVSLIDFRQSHSSYSWKCSVQDSKLNSVQLLPNDENILIAAASGKDGIITIHDLRKASNGSSLRVLKSLNLHSKSINAAYVTPNGEYLVSVSQDNTIRTWKNFLTSDVSSVITRHDNHTGRWLSTFRPSFDTKQPNNFIMGSMDRPRRVEIFQIKSGDIKSSSKSDYSVSLLKAFQGDYLSSVCSRCCAHPALDVILGGNSSGRVHVIR